MSSLSECDTEYDKLQKVLLCTPKYMSIRELINETQIKFQNEGIDVDIATSQHHTFVKALRDHGVDVVLLPPAEQFPEQVFTRDIGFTLGNITFVAEMAHSIRQGEEELLKKWLETKQSSYYNLVDNKIEGGDVLIDQNTIFIGISLRTTMKAVKKLQTLLSEYEIIPIPFQDKYLHLDCVFNILSAKDALIYQNAFNKSELKILEERYNLIEVTEEEQFYLGTNVLSIGHKKLFSLPRNKRINEELTKRGYHVIEVDISEIIKSGGAFRCCTMPIKRASSKVYS